MKFLLVAINAKYIHSNPAIYSLRAFAGEKLSKHTELAEYTINQYSEDILEDICRRKPDAIGFSCYIWNWTLVQDLLTELPKILPDTDLWLGGPEVSFDTEVLLRRFPQLTGVMIGEGEATFKEVLQSYLSDKAFEKVPGLYLHTGYTAMRALTDMSEIPFLYHDLTPFENKIIYYETGRGCPYRCSYCLSSVDKNLRFRKPEIVEKELQFFLDHGVKQVKLVDRTFNCNHEHAMTIWRYIKEHDNGVTNFHFEISADILREDEIELLQSFRPGLAQLEIGVQTINEETLDAIHRVMHVEHLAEIVEKLRKGNNLHLHLDLIAGLPYEDYQSFRQSFNRVYEMRPEQLQLGFLKVLKGSEMWERAEEYGICYLDKPPYEVLYTKWLTYEEVRRLKKVEEMVELYYNSGQFTRTLPVLEGLFQEPFELYEKLGDYYAEKGYFVNHPARIHRYRILLEFALEYDPKRSKLYRELLTFDAYLRENMKSRPEFAVDLAPFKKEIHDFYQREEAARYYLPDYVAYDWKQLSKMTHLEPFWDSVEDEQPAGFVLFDYGKRNPLNYEAKTYVIREYGDTSC